MPQVQIFLKGWRDSRLFADAVNDSDHPLHEDAWPQHLASFHPFKAGEHVYLAATYEGTDLDDLFLCEDSFRLFNVGPEDVEPVKSYRAAGHRSLSVGDVVVVDGRAYTVDYAGFLPVEDFKAIEYVPCRSVADRTGATPLWDCGCIECVVLEAEANKTADVPDAPQNAELSGATYFAAGYPRLVPRPILLAGKKAAEAWYAGWDKANIESPVPGWSAGDQAKYDAALGIERGVS